MFPFACSNIFKQSKYIVSKNKEGTIPITNKTIIKIKNKVNSFLFKSLNLVNDTILIFPKKILL